MSEEPMPNTNEENAKLTPVAKRWFHRIYAFGQDQVMHITSIMPDCPDHEVRVSMIFLCGEEGKGQLNIALTGDQARWAIQQTHGRFCLRCLHLGKEHGLLPCETWSESFCYVHGRPPTPEEEEEVRKLYPGMLDRVVPEEREERGSGLVFEPL